MAGTGVTEPPTLFDKPDPQREADADARAEADVRAGRLISDDAVREWLSSWGPGWPRVGD
jgi:predicted transcriptional regulator